MPIDTNMFPPYPKITCKLSVKEVALINEGSNPAQPKDSKNKFCSSVYEYFLLETFSEHETIKKLKMIRKFFITVKLL